MPMRDIFKVYSSLKITNDSKKIHMSLSANSLLGRQMSGKRSGQTYCSWDGNYPLRPKNHKLANGMNVLTGNWDITTLLFSLRRLEILHKKGRG